MFRLELENEFNNIVNIDDGIRYIITNVSGLNPPSASIFTSKSPNRKGVKYNGSTLNERHIVISIKLLGNVEANRNYLYNWISTEQYTKVRFENDTKRIYCEGHVEECEVDIFTDNEIINVAIICESPYWKDLQEISVEMGMILKQFTFTFAIDKEGIPFSTIKDDNSTSIFNYGAETGVVIRIHCNNEIQNINIFNVNDLTQQFQLNHTFNMNEIIEIDTESSPKTCKLIKTDGTTESILKYVGHNPTWFTLKRGANVFSYTTDSEVTDLDISINYTNKYSGV